MRDIKNGHKNLDLIGSNEGVLGHKNEAYYVRENNYGGGRYTGYTWEEVSSEAQEVGYQPDSAKNRLPFEFDEEGGMSMSAQYQEAA